MSKSKKLEIKVEGTVYWYDQQQEKELTRFMAEKEKIVNPMFAYMKQWMKDNKQEDFYDSKLLQELADFPEEVKNACGVTTARKGVIEKKSLVEQMIPVQKELNALHFNMSQRVAAMGDKEKDYEEARREYYLSDSSKEGSKIWANYYAKYPLTPDQAFPKPGELYACGKVETPSEYKNQISQLRESTKPLGQVIIHGTGGGFDVDTFKELWCNTETFYNPKKADRAPFEWFKPSFWPEHQSYKFGLLDMSKDGKFEEYIGSYPRRMLLLL